MQITAQRMIQVQETASAKTLRRSRLVMFKTSIVGVSE